MIAKYTLADVTAVSPDSGETSESEPSWKKAKHALLAKHINTVSSNDRELQQYRCISVASDDVLHWWKRQAETFPRLSSLAQGILAVPATSAPSERVFSIAGLILQAKRSSLAPENVNKLIFGHNNGHFAE